MTNWWDLSRRNKKLAEILVKRKIAVLVRNEAELI